jgi:methionine aminopeptidase
MVRTYTGHGINSLFHTAPNVPHYAKNKAVGIMHPGQAFTIEPMVNGGNFKDFTWPDDWTAVVRMCSYKQAVPSVLACHDVATGQSCRCLPAGSVLFCHGLTLLAV